MIDGAVTEEKVVTDAGLRRCGRAARGQPASSVSPTAK